MKLNKIQKVFLVIGVIFFLFQCYNFYDLYIRWEQFRNPWLLLDICLYKTLYILLQTIFLIYICKKFDTDLWKNSFQKLFQTFFYFFLIDYLILMTYRVVLLFFPTFGYNLTLDLRGGVSLIEKFSHLSFKYGGGILKPTFYISVIYIYLIFLTIKIIIGKFKNPEIN